MQRVSLQRTTNIGHIRYYRIELFATLFGEFVVEREYGNVKNKTPTGHKKMMYNTIEDAKEAFLMIVDLKQKKGYR